VRNRKFRATAQGFRTSSSLSDSLGSNVYLITDGTLRLIAALDKSDTYRVLTCVRSSDGHCCMNGGAGRARVNM
jgi:hypothetical protein